MTKSNYNYVVIDDDANVCESIEKRMHKFENWFCKGLIYSLKDAIETITKHQPELLFLDWSIKGGNAFTLLETIEKLEKYNPYIIFFTGYQSDHPEIPMELINRFKVHRYLVKPVFENLTLNLNKYVSEAENNITEVRNEFWIISLAKQKLKINPKEIICISQSRANPRNKIIHLINGNNHEIKANWDDCEKIAKEFEISYFFANSRDTLINKSFITKIQKPFIWLNNDLKVEVTKEKWKEFQNS